MTAAVVLAAGAATRYGSPKQRELLPAVLAALEQTAVDRIVVVVGAYPLELPAVRQPCGTPTQRGSGAVTTLVHAAGWARGPGASLRAGLAALGPEVETALVVLADGPDLDPRAVDRVVAHRSDGEVVAASYDGSRNHPVALARAVWGRIPDAGARALEPLLVACDDLTPPGDVDFHR